MDFLSKYVSWIYRMLVMYLREDLKDLGLSVSSFPLLLTINKFEGISQNELARYTRADKALIARTIKKLVELDYVKKQFSSSDCKKQKIFLTIKGKEIVSKLEDSITRWEDEIFIDVDRNHLLEDLKKVKQRCDDLLER